MEKRSDFTADLTARRPRRRYSTSDFIALLGGTPPLEMKPRGKKLHNRYEGNEDCGASSTERADLCSGTTAGGQ